jgi:hypothetical protein
MSINDSVPRNIPCEMMLRIALCVVGIAELSPWNEGLWNQAYVASPITLTTMKRLYRLFMDNCSFQYLSI